MRHRHNEFPPVKTTSTPRKTDLVSSWTAKIRSVNGRINLLIVALCVLPPLWSSPGQVSADTKSYLYLDPGRLLYRATSLWDPSVGAGTVAHQVAGYLWPMGPYFWLMQQVGCPDWVAQRLWWSLLALAASFGMLRLARALGLTATAGCIVALAYAFNPYSLQYLARLSGLLTPWALLPWMLLCVLQVRRSRNLRSGITLGILIATAGSVNVTALVMAFLGVITWIIVDVMTGTVPLRRHIALLATALTTAVTCGAWWIVALLIQGRYGLPILRYTETYETVAKASTPQEILRGLGYWFFYGNDHNGAWVAASTRMIGTTPLLALGMFVSMIALVAIGLARHRHTRHCVALLVVGLAVAVGSNPQGMSSIYGRLFESVVNNESGFALRSSPRATPILLVALAVSLGFAWDHYSTSLRVMCRKHVRSVSFGLVTVLLVAQNYPWVTGHLITPSIARDHTLPAYWTDTARAIDAVTRDPSIIARTYELPGVDFATYTWGGTIDPVTPGLIDSQYLARELVPYGSDATADLLNAFESRIQEGRFEPSSLQPAAAIFGADTVTFRGDLRYDTYRTPNPGRLWRELSLAGLDIRYESRRMSTADATAIADATVLSQPRSESFPVTAVLQATPQPLVSVSPLSEHTRLVGSGDGVIDAVTALGRKSLATFIYDATAAVSPVAFGSPERVIVTDSNRRQSRRWYSVGSNLGRTERADEISRKDPSDNRLMPFVDNHSVVAAPSAQSVSLLVGDITAVSASNHGHPIVSTPEDRPENAFDGDPFTAWRTGIIGRSIGQHVEAIFARPVQASRVELLWPRVGNTERHITRGRIILSSPSSDPERVVEFTATGEDTETTVTFPSTSFQHIRVVIDDDTFGLRSIYDGLPGTGIAEISIPGVRNEEFVLLPTPTDAANNVRNTSYVLSRWRLDESIPNRNDPEARLLRVLDRSQSSTMNISGILRLNGRVDDAILIEASGARQITAASNRRMTGSPYTSAMNLLDGDSASAWVTPLDESVGSSVTFTGLSPSRTSTVSFVDDSWHSRPTKLELTFSDGSTMTADVPESGESFTVQHPVQNNVLTRISVTAISPKFYPDYFSRMDRELPVALTEVSDAVSRGESTPSMTEDCRSDLLTINDEPVPVRLLPQSPSGGNMWTGQPVAFEGCDVVALQDGRNYIESTSGRQTGWNVDRLVLSPTSATNTPSEPVAATILSSNRTRIVARVDSPTSSVVSLGVSNNRGWSATFSGAAGTQVLRDSFVVNGYQHGVVTPGPGIVTFEWTPQRWYQRAMWMSLVAACVAILLIIYLSRRRSTHIDPEDVAPRGSAFVTVVALLVLVVAAPPVAAVVLGVTALFLHFSSRNTLRSLVSLVGISYVVLIAWTVASQVINRYPVTLDWPGRFDSWGSLAWISVGWTAIAGWMSDVPKRAVGGK